MSPLAAPDPDEQVRRLLADARHTGPIPGDVAARLDAVVAALHAEEPATPPPAEHTPPPVDLAARRRRRRARTLLVAATAVVAVGVGVDYVNDPLGSGGGGAAERAGGGASDSMDSAGSPDVPVRLSADGFVDQVRAVLASGGPDDISPSHALTPGCRARGRGVRVPATYDGAPSVLVLRPVRDGVRRVDLYRCEDPEPIRSTTLPVR